MDFLITSREVYRLRNSKLIVLAGFVVTLDLDLGSNKKTTFAFINVQQPPQIPVPLNCDEDNENFLIIRSLKNKEG